ncbi:MAG TPA: substrate-binding domain-containing protein [Acidimicrobiales bacterium]|nr:substrate-binding domain-containing protein [Acidimicrobiales bacterium]
MVRSYGKKLMAGSVVIGMLAIGMGAASTAGAFSASAAHPATSLAAAEALASFENGANASLSGGANIVGKTVVFQVYTDESTSFFVPAVNGAKAAAALTGLNLDLEYSNSDDATQVNQLEVAIASHVAGIAASLPDGATDKAICAAEAAHIPVLAWNVDGLTGSALNCVEGFIGQDFVSAGQVIAQRMVSDGAIKKGDHVFCPVETTTAVYAVQRYQGVMDVLSKLGASCSLLAVGFGASGAETTMVDYLLGHRQTSAILALGSTPLTVAVAAAQKAGLKVPIGGFDLTNNILTGIKSGQIMATVDQQPYSQGFFAVLQLALQLKYALFPSSMNTGGTGLVDSSNVDQVLSLVPNYQ